MVGFGDNPHVHILFQSATGNPFLVLPYGLQDSHNSHEFIGQMYFSALSLGRTYIFYDDTEIVETSAQSSLL